MTWAAALAAIVSILAAVTAFLSARKAEQEARSVTTLNHKIAAVDRQAEQLRDDYRGLMKAIGDFKVHRNVGSIIAAGEVLSAHPRASEPLSAAIEQLANGLATREAAGVDDFIVGIRGGFRESLAEIEQSRSGLLG